MCPLEQDKSKQSATNTLWQAHVLYLKTMNKLMNLTLCVAYFERMYSLYSVAWFTIILCYFFSPTKLVNCESKNWDLIYCLGSFNLLSIWDPRHMSPDSALAQFSKISFMCLCLKARVCVPCLYIRCLWDQKTVLETMELTLGFCFSFELSVSIFTTVEQ